MRHGELGVEFRGAPKCAGCFLHEVTVAVAEAFLVGTQGLEIRGEAGGDVGLRSGFAGCQPVEDPSGRLVNHAKDRLGVVALDLVGDLGGIVFQ